MVYDNNGFVHDEDEFKKNAQNGYNVDIELDNKTEKTEAESSNTVDERKRDSWGNDIEFLMSCIAMSVGLGNVWRFPYVAFRNGGGAFLIPYLIVLVIVGRPLYYLEMIIGQFSSRGSIRVYDMAPAMQGTGYGQVYGVFLLSTFYASLMALILTYLINSFYNPLPWSECRDEWSNCIPSSGQTHDLREESTGPFIDEKQLNSSMIYSNTTNYFDYLLKATTKNGITPISSSEYYFVKVVLKETDNIEDGIGVPDWQLTLYLVISWVVILIVLIKGVRSSGKASYFLALFPYAVMIILLVRAVTLPGAGAGILYFIRPQWDKILEPRVWYEAVTQCFFSLAVCFGNIIMYSSYNKFSHNVYRDVNIITALDTFTSLMAGCTIFGIIGNLAFQLGIEDVGAVIQPGAGLAFISYPDAIAKFDWLPQVFSVLFFVMLFVLGIGSNIAMATCVMTAVRDQFPKVKHWQAAGCICSVGLLVGLVYVTPGGQYILTLVDFFGVSLIALILAIAELVCVSWIYGVDRLCKDTEFMTGRNPGIYWRLCWGLITPVLMMVILAYTLIRNEPIEYKDVPLPNNLIGIGYGITAFGILQLPIWAFITVLRQNGSSWCEKFSAAFKPSLDWGPRQPATFDRYQAHIKQIRKDQEVEKNNIVRRFKRNIFG